MLIYWGVRYFLAAVFLWFGISKLLDPLSFSVLIDAYNLIPKTWVMPAAILLSFLEIIAGGGLIPDIHGSLGIIIGMMILFIAILFYGIHMGLDINCGCFGPQAPEARAFHGLPTAEAWINKRVSLLRRHFCLERRQIPDRGRGINQITDGC